MVHSSDSKKSQKNGSNSYSKDEVRDEISFSRLQNEELTSFLDNHDDILREAKKVKRELRASLEDARNRVAELETQNLDAKL
jgi:flagellar motility protein MotE (MotC chaperone)